LVIFDCDGVLVDSETMSCRIVADVLAQAGFSLTCEDVVSQFIGVSDCEMYTEMERQHGKTIPVELRRRIADDVLEALSSRLEPTDGIHDALRAIALPKCVASGSDGVRVRESLARTGLLEFFSPHIFTTEKVARGKPAPDVFLYAAERLQVSPERCVVVEDSRAGVQAGRAAGMSVLGYVGASHCGADHADALLGDGAVHVFDSMHRLPGLLDEVAHQCQPPL
jgi:HAD superfamily hydrolase (TIGR01509 family)